MRYFYVKDGILSEYLGVIKSAAEMAGFVTYSGDKSPEWLKLSDEGQVVELTTSEYEAAHPFDVMRHVYSKYKVKQKLQSLTTAEGKNLWDFVKKQLTADQYEDMMLAQDFCLSDDGFMLLYTKLTAAGVDMDAILKECVL